MRIETAPGQAVPNVTLWLTRAEASELRDSLEQMLGDPAPERHEHVASADYRTEITVTWERP
jgi:hypothetical protein